MTYQMWCQVKSEDAIREANQYRLIKIANPPHNTLNQKRLSKLVNALSRLFYIDYLTDGYQDKH